MNIKPVIVISFSGGRTSAYMTYWLLNNYSSQYTFIVVFANTGQEHDRTLWFVNKCDQEWGFNTVWLEAVVNPEDGKGTRHKVVNYETASRKGEPYLDVVKKYGLPSHAYLHCTRELKEAPIKSYIKSLGIKDYKIALGIRLDEPKRHNKADNVLHPLVDWFPKTKNEILTFFSQNNFDLEIPEHKGNCKWCFKKSLNKLIKLAKENPEYFLFPKMLEDNYSHIKAEHVGGERKIFRGYRTTKNIMELAYNDDEYLNYIEEITKDDIEKNECAESCEPFN